LFLFPGSQLAAVGFAVRLDLLIDVLFLRVARHGTQFDDQSILLIRRLE